MKAAALKKVSLEDSQDFAVRVANSFLDRAKETGEDLCYQLSRQVRRHPWKAAMVALGIGLVLGARAKSILT